ncbi:prepilin-type N-terminal cleavage/methylation domain-containing protein [Tumebacillus permanentifrigoris]|uniref:Prepilin-type N-terminal cleavage/methylation domain-containing protein n=1 Tax=Tumebacillus permanentifrigoris TaxID=378543 RepID=A0A316D4D7_9BACL|nr:prepilin-type N-terminal cleavage/methylation domain-containing protein [Tumebacillus permanentifrigoris]PWK06285.1 prepilin-type N-terminal cleavage/methylation domain-containing protein [Tumebacillus permanentifrigoris]
MISTKIPSNISTEKPHPLHAEHGYTLLELLVTLFLLSSLFAMTFPSLKRLFQHYELDVSARQLATQMRNDQMSAWSRADVQEIWLNRFKPQYQLWRNGQFTGQVKLPDTIQYLNGYLEPSAAVFRFDATGVLTGGGQVRLLNKLREAADLNVYLTTGTVVYEGVHP